MACYVILLKKCMLGLDSTFLDCKKQMQTERQNIGQDQNKENDTQVSGMLQLRVMYSFC